MVELFKAYNDLLNSLKIYPDNCYQICLVVQLRCFSNLEEQCVIKLSPSPIQLAWCGWIQLPNLRTLRLGAIRGDLQGLGRHRNWESWIARGCRWQHRSVEMNISGILYISVNIKLNLSGPDKVISFVQVYLLESLYQDEARLRGSLSHSWHCPSTSCTPA